jgi:uncharacterized protein (DUF1330 family)
MSAYLIAQHHVSDRAGFEEWRSKVIPIIEQNEGRFVVRSDNVDVLEWSAPLQPDRRRAYD